MTPERASFFKIIQQSSIPKLKELLKTNNFAQSDFNLAVSTAATTGQTHMIKYLIEHYHADPSVNSNYALRIAVINGHAESVSELLKHANVDPSDFNQFVIKRASALGHEAIVRKLLEHSDVDVHTEDNAPMKLAIDNAQIGVIRALLSEKAISSTEALRYFKSKPLGHFQSKSLEKEHSELKDFLENVHKGTIDPANYLTLNEKLAMVGDEDISIIDDLFIFTPDETNIHEAANTLVEKFNKIDTSATSVTSGLQIDTFDDTKDTIPSTDDLLLRTSTDIL